MKMEDVMIEFKGPEGQIIAATMELAKTRPWRDITMLDIAAAADISLVDLRERFTSKAAILSAFTRAVDDVVIAAPPAVEDGENARDRIFEVIMNRFDVLAPYKQALKSITACGIPEPLQICAVASAQYWMLQAAGVPTDGLRGNVRVAGLMSVYTSVFRTWLNDDEEGLARTMAKLDRRLRRGESSLRRADELAYGVARSGRRLCKMAACSMPWNWSKLASDGGEDTGGPSETDDATIAVNDVAPGNDTGGGAPAPAV